MLFNFVYLPRPGSSKVFVFLHGLMGSAAQFKHQIAELKEIGSILAIDYTGHGMTPVSGDPSHYTTAAIVEHVRSIITDNSIKGDEIILICHSYGTIIGLRVSQTIDVAKIVYLTPKVAFTEEEIFCGGGTGVAASPELLKSQLEYNSNTSTITLKNTLLGFEVVHKQEYIDSKVPSIVIGGLQDKVCRIESNITPLKEYLGDLTEVFLLDTGHMVLLEDPDAVNALILKFVSKTD